MQEKTRDHFEIIRGDTAVIPIWIFRRSSRDSDARYPVILTSDMTFEVILPGGVSATTAGAQVTFVAGSVPYIIAKFSTTQTPLLTVKKFATIVVRVTKADGTVKTYQKKKVLDIVDRDN